MKNRTPATNSIQYLLTMTAISALAACGGNGPDPAAASSKTGDSTQSMQTESAQTIPSEEAGSEPTADTAQGSSSSPGAEGTEAAATETSCEFEVEVGDNLQYSVSQITAPAACSEFSIKLSHTGNLPANAMGHNWVLVPQGTGMNIARAGASKGLDGDYLADDERIIAATEVIGGGESASITFALGDLSGGYTYICTYPGHGAAMNGTFTVES